MRKKKVPAAPVDTSIIDIMRTGRARWAKSLPAEAREALPWAWRVRAGQNTITGLSRTEEQATKNAENAARKIRGEHIKVRGPVGIELGSKKRRAA